MRIKYTQEVPISIRVLLSLRQSTLQSNTSERILKGLSSIVGTKGFKKMEEQAERILPMIESGISDEDLLQVLEEMEANL